MKYKGLIFGLAALLGFLWLAKKSKAPTGVPRTDPRTDLEWLVDDYWNGWHIAVSDSPGRFYMTHAFGLQYGTTIYADWPALIIAEAIATGAVQSASQVTFNSGKVYFKGNEVVVPPQPAPVPPAPAPPETTHRFNVDDLIVAPIPEGYNEPNLRALFYRKIESVNTATGFYTYLHMYSTGEFFRSDDDYTAPFSTIDNLYSLA